MAADPASLSLIQFAREPVVGRVKTRMTPYLSASQACDLHCELTIWTCRQLVASRLATVELSIAGDVSHTLFDRCRALGVNCFSQQRGADLGERMYHAITGGLAEAECVILVGSDCPGIDAGYLQQALAALRSAEVVLGPATDGGYVLVGARKIHPRVFREIPWGDSEVFVRTVAALEEVGLNWARLPALTDIDRPEDLPVWDAIKREAHAGVN